MGPGIASTWGLSWGSSWAVSWDRGTTPTPPPAPTQQIGGVGKKRRIYIKIDDDVFEVATQQEAEQLFLQARELAQATAAKAATKAVAKAARAKTPAAKRRAESMPLPQIAIVVDPGFNHPEFAHQLQAQGDAASAYIAAIYAQALKAQQKATQEDEDEVVQILTMDADEDEKLVRDFLKTMKRRK